MMMCFFFCGVCGGVPRATEAGVYVPMTARIGANTALVLIMRHVEARDGWLAESSEPREEGQVLNTTDT